MVDISVEKKIALVTGASSGIGAAVACALAREGMLVILSARRLERLNQLAKEIQESGGSAAVLEADFSREEECERVFKRVIGDYGKLDLLVNNAGIGYYGFAAEMPWETAREILAVNIEAVVHLALLFLPGMKARSSGQVINISSIAGKLPNQGIAVYSSSKSFMDSFTTSLYREMKGSGVHISALRPGPVTSEFFDTAQKISWGSRRTPGELFAISPERVAKAVVSLVHRPRRTAYVPKYLIISPLLELFFGWAIDLVGPILLKKQISSPYNGIK
jgi:short-subunit dehydrogenase